MQFVPAGALSSVNATDFKTFSDAIGEARTAYGFTVTTAYKSFTYKAKDRAIAQEQSISIGDSDKYPLDNQDISDVISATKFGIDITLHHAYNLAISWVSIIGEENMIFLVFPKPFEFVKALRALHDDKRLIVHTTVYNETHSFDVVCYNDGSAGSPSYRMFLCKVIDDSDVGFLLKFYKFLTEFKKRYENHGFHHFRFAIFGTCGSIKTPGTAKEWPIGTAYFINVAFKGDRGHIGDRDTLEGSEPADNSYFGHVNTKKDCAPTDRGLIDVKTKKEDGDPVFTFRPDIRPEKRLRASVTGNTTFQRGFAICSTNSLMEARNHLLLEKVNLYDMETYDFFMVAQDVGATLLGAIRVVSDNCGASQKINRLFCSFREGVEILKDIVERDASFCARGVPTGSKLLYVDLVQHVNDPTMLASLPNLLRRPGGTDGVARSCDFDAAKVSAHAFSNAMLEKLKSTITQAIVASVKTERSKISYNIQYAIDKEVEKRNALVATPDVDACTQAARALNHCTQISELKTLKLKVEDETTNLVELIMAKTSFSELAPPETTERVGWIKASESDMHLLADDDIRTALRRASWYIQWGDQKESINKDDEDTRVKEYARRVAIIMHKYDELIKSIKPKDHVNPTWLDSFSAKVARHAAEHDSAGASAAADEYSSRVRAALTADEKLRWQVMALAKNAARKNDIRHLSLDLFGPNSRSVTPE
ncbi:hypothetical protein HDU90_008588 [Geranomyces variabilis]|nr:hypothetical protein HDU90_008588 [Geranomyces variabilis]